MGEHDCLVNCMYMSISISNFLANIYYDPHMTVVSSLFFTIYFNVKFLNLIIEGGLTILHLGIKVQFLIYHIVQKVTHKLCSAIVHTCQAKHLAS